MWTGLLKIAHKLKPDLREILDTLLQEDEIRQHGRMPTLLNELNKRGYPIHVIYITGHWMNIDDIKDLVEAGSF
jgi:phosphoenolpyruvate phosphomutase